MSAWVRLALVFILAPPVSACGNDATPAIDAGTPDAGPTIGPVHEVPPLEDRNHAAEVSIAARDGHVVAAFVGLRSDSPDDFDYPPADGLSYKRVTVVRSHDSGETFSEPVSIVAPNGADTTDPSVAVTDDGVFWLAALEVETYNAVVWWSGDHGDTWTPVDLDLPITDKPWLAAAPSGDSVFLMGVAGAYQVGSDGTLLAEHREMASRNAVAGYVDGTTTARFLTMAGGVVGWDGTGEPFFEGDPLDLGDTPELWSRSAGALGSVGNLQWIVHGRRQSETPSVILRVREPPGATGFERRVSASGQIAFLPAAASDADGRLHVVWYDTGASSGRLLYARSSSSDLMEPFMPPIVVDDDACPGDDWQPEYGAGSDPVGGRRLREYIGLAVDGRRTHIAWTHAPDAPSQLRLTYIDF